MNKNSKAFSLTELLIVLVVIALLFAALAPIITKRHISETHENESIWNLISGDTERNAYFDPGNEKWTSSVYVGMIPTTSNTSAGKLVIDSGNITYNSLTYKQPQIQFRFSKSPTEQGRGVNAANLYVDSSSIIFGKFSPNMNYDKTTVYGLNNLSAVSTNAKGVTVLGFAAMEDAKITEKNPQYVVAVGNRAGNKIGASDSTVSVNSIFLGSNAGAGIAETTDAPTDNIAIGYKSLSRDNTLGSHNVFIGLHTGNGFNNSNASYNTIVGSAFSGTSASYNTIIGYGVYTKGDSTVKAMTAIGYGACNSISGNNLGSRVCIGYNSAVSTNNTPASFNTDSGEHIFIGGKPDTSKTRGYPGRAVLEVHNNTVNSYTYGNVVLNSNLVLRGNFFPSDGVNIAYNVFKNTQDIGAEDVYYRCSSDAYQSILSYNAYVCKSLTASDPKSINVLFKQDNCSNDSGYPSGDGCPNVISSDKRLKSDIVPNNDGLDKILAIEPYIYSYKNEPSKKHVGVIAQHLLKIFPNAVSKDEEGFLRIRLEDMFYALVNSIKELASAVDNLYSKLAEIEQDILSVNKDQKIINKQLYVLDKKIKKLERN